jgi:hypothetical protein
MTNVELNNLHDSQSKLLKEQKLLKFVLDDCLSNNRSKVISNESFASAK